jgi:aminoglycoside phosphotransferase (APT) family kinase protein
MIEREFAVMDGLKGSGVPVPAMLALCDDPAVIGAAFFLMDFVDGRIFWDPALPDLPRHERTAAFASMNETVARLHMVDPAAVGLADFGRPQDFMGRQVRRWTEQYRAAETRPIAAMESLITWLPGRLPPDSPRPALFHGDLRLDNMIFHPTEPRVVAVLDWELSTLGDPIADLAYHMMTWRIPPELFRGLHGLDLEALGIPGEEAYRADYFARMGRDDSVDWPFYLAFGLFRVASILQGVAKRAQDGNASSPEASHVGAKAEPLAEIGWRIAQEGS